MVDMVSTLGSVEGSYTASHALLDALVANGVTHLFANFGSDHPAIIEAILEGREKGLAVPEVITCPNEMVAMSAAHGFWLASGKAQAVLVHVDCGTVNIGSALHAADKGRAAIFVLSGMSPATLHGELRGSRNEFAMYLQDIHDQRSIVRNYMRYDGEVRTGRNIRELVNRSFQFANSDPKGPVYLMAPREILEEEVDPQPANTREWRPIEPGALSQEAIQTIGQALLNAERPLAITRYVGRNPHAVAPFVELCEMLGMGVHEACPAAMNFPHDNTLYLGNQWNQAHQSEALAAADCIFVLDSDVPWIPTSSRPSPDARIFHIDVDPLKQSMPHWRIEAEGSYRADAATALRQLCAWLADKVASRGKDLSGTFWRAMNERRTERLDQLENAAGEVLTSEFAVGRFRNFLTDDMVVMNESIANYHVVFDHLKLSKPGQIHTSGSGSLGWNGGAAFGAGLANPDSIPVAFTGDGSYLFSIPDVVHWMSRRYEVPFLTVIFNNRGWRSPKSSTLALYPDGRASRLAQFDTSFDPAPDYGAIATAAGGAWSAKVSNPDELDSVYREALRVIREERRSAVVELVLEHH